MAPTAHKSTDLDPKRELKPPIFIELESINEIARLACALERAPLPVFASKYDSQYMIATQLDLFLGAPIFYFAYSNETKHYLGYKTVPSGEEVGLFDTPSNPSFAYAPIIEVLSFPSIFEEGIHRRRKYSGPKFLCLKVKDLTSLVKVASYKVMFEEPPLPIFAFPSSKGEVWRIGTFTRIEDFEEASIFFSYEQDLRPGYNYAGYSASKVDAFFTNKTDEHGHLYVKIIRLKEPHPLVDSD